MDILVNEIFLYLKFFLIYGQNCNYIGAFWLLIFLWKPFITHHLSNLICNRQSGNLYLLCPFQEPLQCVTAEHQDVCLDLCDLWGFCWQKLCFHAGVPAHYWLEGLGLLAGYHGELMDIIIPLPKSMALRNKNRWSPSTWLCHRWYY